MSRLAKVWRMATTAEQQFMSLDQASQAIARIAPVNREFTLGEDGNLGTTNISGTPTVSLRLGSEEILLTEPAKRDLLSLVGLPGNLEETFGDDRELLERIVTHANRKRRGDLYTLQSEQDRAVSVVSGRVDKIQIGQVWELVQELPGILGVHQVTGYSTRGGSHAELRVVSETTNSPLKERGDISHAGLWLGINGSVKAAPYVHRLVCTNGLMLFDTSKNVRVSGRLELEQAFDATANLIVEAWEASQTFLADFVHTAEIAPTGGPDRFLANLMRENRISDRTRARLVEQLPTLPQNASVYDLTNLVTAYAQGLDKRPKRIALEGFGGNVVSSAVTNEHRCTSCHSAI